MFEYGGIKELARQVGCRTTDLLVLSQQNDPFYAGVASRRERGEWFAEQWDRFGFQHGAHLRRIHYVLVSQPDPIRWPDGDPYENTQNNWARLINASLAARYLHLIPDDVLVDRRNPSPLIHAAFSGNRAPEVICEDAELDLNMPSELPVPELYLINFERDQNFLVEVWAEKSTMNDILVPLCHRLGLNLITGVGEMSETATRRAVERAIDADKPMRILYVSDFDPAGRSMPVAVARKIEHRLYDADISADIALDPIVLTPEQCEEYELPRTPIKETERRAAKFEEAFGAGATELDALEALHPGILAQVVSAEACRYIDTTLPGRVSAAASDIRRHIREIETEVRERHGDKINRLAEQYYDLTLAIEDFEGDAEDLWQTLKEELEANAPVIDADMIPEPRDATPPPQPLYDSSRDYFRQLQSYKHWQNK